MALSVRNLNEITITLIRDYIRANMQMALDLVAAQRGTTEYAVSLTAPESNSYFVYNGAKGLRLPAVFVGDGVMDFRQPEKGSNFINAMVPVKVMAVVEDQDAERLTFGCWRYESALHYLLDQTTLLSQDKSTKLVVVVRKADPSPVFISDEIGDPSEGVFKKQITLECDVEHYENY